MKFFKELLKFYVLKKRLAKIVETKFVENKAYLCTSIVAQLVEALRCSRKVAGSIPDDVIGIFY
jgi:hypothetical protein